MDIGSIFLILGLLIIVSLYVSRPFIERRASAVMQVEHERSALLAERDRVLNALQELDFDHALGKIPAADYPVQRAALLQQGAQILRQLDAFQSGAPAQDVEARLEAAIEARRIETGGNQALPNGSGARLVAAAPDDQLEALIANRRRQRNEKAAGFCPRCGNPLQKSDRFCPGCGFNLA